MDGQRVTFLSLLSRSFYWLPTCFEDLWMFRLVLQLYKSGLRQKVRFLKVCVVVRVFLLPQQFLFVIFRRNSDYHTDLKNHWLFDVDQSFSWVSQKETVEAAGKQECQEKKNSCQLRGAQILPLPTTTETANLHSLSCVFGRRLCGACAPDLFWHIAIIL